MQACVDKFFQYLSEPNAAFVFRCGVGIIPFYVGINPIAGIQCAANGSIGIIEFFHKVFGIGDGGLIGATKVVVEYDEGSKSVVRIDAICHSRPAFQTYFSEVVIIEFIKEVQMLYPFVEAIPKVYAEMTIVFRDVQCAFPLFVLVALLVESLAYTTFQNVNVFQRSAQNEI